MSVTTTYDEMRAKLKEDLSSCVRQARELLNEDIWGYDEMNHDYAEKIYFAVKTARDMV